jgi:hypothetical protein
MNRPREVLEFKLSKIFDRHVHSRPGNGMQRVRNDDSTRRRKLLQTGRYVDTGSVYVFFLGDHFADIQTDAEAYL